MSSRPSRSFAATNTRNICIVGHVDHGKSSYADSLLAANSIISQRMAGKMRYLDSREDEQERGITMESSAVSLSYRTMKKALDGSQPIQEDYMINLIDTPGHVDFSSEVSTASRLCDGALVMVDAVEGVCTQTITVLRQAWQERLKPILVINKVDRLITELRLAPIEAHHHLTQLVEQVNAVMGSFHASERMEDDLRWREERSKRLAAKKERQEDTAAGLANQAGSAEASTSSSTGQTEVHNDSNDGDDDLYEEKDDEDLYFAPEQGNVIFASAIDGWAFRISQFAQIHAARLGIKESNLRKVLWGDFYLDPKTKRVLARKHLGKRSLKPMFVQFVLENLWAVYDSVILNYNQEKIAKIVAALGLKIRPQDLKTKDYRSLLNVILSQWLPLAPATFRGIVEIIPSPSSAQALRIPKMLHPDLPYYQTDVQPLNKLEEDLYSGSTAEDAYVVAYISKMFAVPADALPENQRQPITAEEMRARGRASREAAAALAATGAVVSNEGRALESQAESLRADSESIPYDTLNKNEHTAIAADVDTIMPAEVLLGFARLYSGTMRKGQDLLAVLPKFNPKLPPSHPKNTKFVTHVKIERLYMMMGRDLVAIDEVPAGNVFAVGGLEGKILRNGTLCGYSNRSTTNEDIGDAASSLVNLAGLYMTSAPIVRVALEPNDPAQLPKLVEGLRLLNQADSCVETLLQETGEHVILTAGELHLERCLKDLRERFAKIEIHASAPIVPFRETTVHGIDMPPTKASDAERGSVNGSVQNGLLTYRVRARPLPDAVTAFLIANADTMKRVVQREHELAGSDENLLLEDRLELQESTVNDTGVSSNQLSIHEFWKRLENLLNAAGKEWEGTARDIWAFGARRTGANILLNKISKSTRSLMRTSQTAKHVSTISTPARAATPADHDSKEDENEILEVTEHIEQQTAEMQAHSPSDLRMFEDSIETAFQLSTLRGPLCNEPVQGLAYTIEALEIHEDHAEAELLRTRLSQITGGIIAAAQDSFKQGFLDWSPRLLLAMYSCDIQASTEVLGKVYGVIARRRGRIVSEEMKEGTSFFTISALLPVVESFNFAEEIRKRTSGAAYPQLVFHGFELLDQDPYWVPTTEEELEDLGEKAERENVARRYMDSVRKRKGLFVEKKVVEFAEKQRTLKR